MGRMDQLSRTQEFKPEVSLFSASPNAYELLFSIWWGSRHNKSYTPKDLHQLINPVSEVVVTHGDVNPLQMTDDILRAYPEYTLKECPSFIADLRSIFFNIVSTLFDSDLPPLEAVNFTFEIDAASVAFREQLVRDRRAGYWTQTSRTMDLQFMDVNMAHSIPLLGGDSAVDLYKSTVDVIRRAYRDLQKMGIPTEDIRLQPTAQVHRIYWMINLRNLMRVLHKRVDWIAQSSLWSPIISGVLHSLEKELDPALMNIIRDRVGAPKVALSEDKKKVVSHSYDIENQDRFTGKDPQPVDPLWLAYHNERMPASTDVSFYDYLKSMYLKIWPREYIDLLGWVRDDPSVLGPYDRP